MLKCGYVKNVLVKASNESKKQEYNLSKGKPFNLQ